jgi:Flp pilus assembly protein TadG
MNARTGHERGQTVVMIALALVALIAMVGLAIDGGMVYLERRRMQNAADSAALAGARRLSQAICATNPNPATSPTPKSTTWSGTSSPATGEPMPNLRPTTWASPATGWWSTARRSWWEAGQFPSTPAGIVVTTTITQPTYFLGLVGASTGRASASATAVTGPPLLVSGGLRPFGVPAPVVAQLNPGDWLTVDFDNNGGTIRWVSGEAQHRGWMNLGYVWNQRENPNWPRARDQNTGASDLKRWMQDGWNGTLYADCAWSAGCRTGDYIHAKPGADASAVCAAPLNTVFYVPVYDEVPYCQTQIPAPKPACPTQGGGYCYHIVGFAAIKITACSQGQKEIAATLVEYISGEGVPSPNAGFGPGSNACANHTMVVSLWR